MYVIRRKSDGKYVAKSGNASSYTKYLDKAVTYETIGQAKSNLCVESETIVSVESILSTQFINRIFKGGNIR